MGSNFVVIRVPFAPFFPRKGSSLNAPGKKRKRKATSDKPVSVGPPPAVQSIIMTVRPSDDRTGDPGMAAEGWYFIQGDVLTMCDERGKPLDGEKFTAVVTEANAHAVAAQMTKRRWSESRTNDFDGPLNYGPLRGIV
jgi:hypothetical protein